MQNCFETVNPRIMEMTETYIHNLVMIADSALHREKVKEDVVDMLSYSVRGLRYTEYCSLCVHHTFCCIRCRFICLHFRDLDVHNRMCTVEWHAYVWMQETEMPKNSACGHTRNQMWWLSPVRWIDPNPRWHSPPIQSPTSPPFTLPPQ